jgi:hypothetical protein
MSWQDGLTGPALEVAKSTQSPPRVMAGPGTGKAIGGGRQTQMGWEG